MMFGSGRVSFVRNHIILMETLISFRENLMTPETSLFEIMNMAYIITGPVFVILALLYSLNSCVNPWIYLAFNKELPKLLLRHYTASSKNYRTAAGGNSASNSSGDAQSTSLRPFSRWSLCNSARSNKYPTRVPHRPYVAQYNARRWIVTTSTWNMDGGCYSRDNHDKDDISGSSLIEISELTTELTELEVTETVMWWNLRQTTMC
jgi:hypothetical protein